MPGGGVALIRSQDALSKDGKTAGRQDGRRPGFGWGVSLVTHIPDPSQILQRYYGWYASRTRTARAGAER